ncbi:MAG: ATP-binding protein [Alphaproteobacteria bacterium]|nr:ATP-binding protein [Alphaproteobacteria bacterium]
MNNSLRRRLMIILCGSVVAAWLATAFFSYLDTKRQIDQMLDTSLIQSANLLLVLLNQSPPGELGGARPIELGTEKRQMIAYRVLAGNGNQEIKSPGMPTFSPDNRQQGFDDRTSNNEQWRVYGIETEKGFFIEVAQQHKFRATFAENVATHILHPVWFAVPLLAVLIWLSVRWGLIPLQKAAENVEKRSANNLEPLNSHEAPLEIRPLLNALNSLFARIGVLLGRERQFTSDAAHELRTPLAAIKTHSQVARQARDPGERSQALDNVIQGTDRAIRLVEQLLVLARLDHQSLSATQEPVNLTEIVVKEVINQTPTATVKQVDLGVSEEADEKATITGNPDLLDILIRNLLDNAVRYTPEGGKVNASVRQRDNHVFLQIADSGLGIPAERRQRVFDRFYRIEGSAEQGCGLGLSIVSRIAEIYGASIKLTDGLGTSGLTVTVTFPLQSTSSH